MEVAVASKNSLPPRSSGPGDGQKQREGESIVQGAHEIGREGARAGVEIAPACARPTLEGRQKDSPGVATEGPVMGSGETVGEDRVAPTQVPRPGEIDHGPHTAAPRPARVHARRAQTPSLQSLPSLAHAWPAGTGEPAHVPPAQTSPVEHSLPSLQGVVLGTCVHALVALQMSSVQGLKSLAHAWPAGTGEPAHVPPAQTSPVEHSLPSLQGVVLGTCVHALVALQTSSVHGLPSLAHAWPAGAGEPAHVPPAQTSPVEHSLPSSHAWPAGSIAHSAEQQSPLTTLPSSHCSPGSSIPFEHLVPETVPEIPGQLELIVAANTAPSPVPSKTTAVQIPGTCPVTENAPVLGTTVPLPEKPKHVPEVAVICKTVPVCAKVNSHENGAPPPRETWLA